MGLSKKWVLFIGVVFALSNGTLADENTPDTLLCQLRHYEASSIGGHQAIGNVYAESDALLPVARELPNTKSARVILETESVKVDAMLFEDTVLGNQTLTVMYLNSFENEAGEAEHVQNRVDFQGVQSQESVEMTFPAKGTLTLEEDGNTVVHQLSQVEIRCNRL